MRSIFRKQDGFTLIELMVSAGLVSLIVIGAFRIYYLTDRSFVAGTVQADIQSDMQQAMRRITEDLRVAHRVEFTNKVDGDKLADGGHYLYADEGMIVVQTENGVRPITSHYQESARYKVSFSESRDELGRLLPDTVRVVLESETPGVPFTLETHVQALNLRLGGISGSAPSAMLYYTKDFSAEEIEEGERLRRVCLFTSILFDPHDPEVQAMRNFRDSVLSKVGFGQRVIAYYYELSPVIVEFLSGKPAVIETAVSALRPVILLAEVMAQVPYALVVQVTLFMLALVAVLKRFPYVRM